MFRLKVGVVQIKMKLRKGLIQSHQNDTRMNKFPNRYVISDGPLSTQLVTQYI